MRKPKRKDGHQFTTLGILITCTLYMVGLPWAIRQAADGAATGDVFNITFYTLITFVMINFQFMHVDEYTQQRGYEHNVAGILTFFLVTMFLINSVVETL